MKSAEHTVSSLEYGTLTLLAQPVSLHETCCDAPDACGQGILDGARVPLAPVATSGNLTLVARRLTASADRDLVALQASGVTSTKTPVDPGLLLHQQNAHCRIPLGAVGQAA